MNKNVSKLSPLTEATFYVLLATQKPIHGYGIIKAVEDVTEGRIILAAGTLYGSLANLAKYECIKLVSTSKTRRKKEYEITDLGRELLQNEISRIESMIKHAEIIGGEK